MGTVMDRRFLPVLLVPALAFASSAAASTAKPTSWAAPQIQAVTAAGLMGAKTVATFRANDPLTAQELENLVFDLKLRLAPPPVVTPVPPVVPTVPTVTGPTVTTPTVTAPTVT